MALCITVDLVARETKKTNHWPLIQTFCFPEQEDVKTEGSGGKIYEGTVLVLMRTWDLRLAKQSLIFKTLGVL